MCWQYRIRVLPPIKANKYSKNLGPRVREDDVVKVNEIIPDTVRLRGKSLPHKGNDGSRIQPA